MDVIYRTMKRKASISDDEATIRELRKSPEFAAEYLRAALEDADEPRVLLIALRRIAKARGGIAKVAKAAGIERESLYRASWKSSPFHPGCCDQSSRIEAHGRSRAIRKHPSWKRLSRGRAAIYGRVEANFRNAGLSRSRP